MEWDLAAHNADMMLDKCNWSRATCTYMKAAFLYMKMSEDKNTDLKDEVNELFRYNYDKNQIYDILSW